MDLPFHYQPKALLLLLLHHQDLPEGTWELLMLDQRQPLPVQVQRATETGHCLLGVQSEGQQCGPG